MKHRYTPSVIDVEIRDIIARLNKIRFCHTRFSCAGYGKAGEAPIDRYKGEYDKDDPTGHKPQKGFWSGYILAAYDDKIDKAGNWKTLHEQLSAVADEVVAHKKSHPIRQRAGGIPTAAYHFRSTTKNGLQRKWDKVRGVLDSLGY